MSDLAKDVIREMTEAALLHGERYEIERWRDVLSSEIEKLEDFLRSSGFVPCDIPSCNCGSWHQTGGFAARFREIEDATNDYWRNGETLLDRIRRIVAALEQSDD